MNIRIRTMAFTAAVLATCILHAGISTPVWPQTRKGKSKLKLAEVPMTPPLVSELAYTNLLSIMQSNVLLGVSAGPFSLEPKVKRKTGEIKMWSYSEKDRATKFKVKIKVLAKNGKFKMKISQALPESVVVCAPGKAAVVNELAAIAGGVFFMGASNQYYSPSSPENIVHQVNVSAFMIEKCEVSNGRMCQVLQWAYDHGLLNASATSLQNSEGTPQTLINLANYACDITFANGVFLVKNGREGFPCSVATWYGALAYCNYRSDIEGFTRCIDFTTWSCDVARTGYRLPTEAEWEKAARGGLVAQWYPWPGAGGVCTDHIDGSKADYYLSGGTFHSDLAVCGYYNGGQLPPGGDMANGYGLYDMAGNAQEWCWDWYKQDFYKDAAATAPDTMGPVQDGALFYKVVRGGGWGMQSHALRCAARDDALPTDSAYRGIGFRCVRRP